MFGPHLQATSGISNVVNNWLAAGLAEHVELRFISTLRHSVPGRLVMKVFEGLGAWLQAATLNRQRCDIVHIHFAGGMSFLRKYGVFRIARARGFRTVIHMHVSEFSKLYGATGRRTQARVRRFFRDADRLLVLSESWAQLCREICPEASIRVLRNGASATAFAGRIAHNGRLNIAMMGRLCTRKGTYDLVAAFARLAPEFPSARLVLGGDGELTEVAAFADAKGVRDRVEIPGWLKGQDKIDVFRAADVYALPSYDEGMPGSVLEAMAAGLPIVATPVGGTADLVVDSRNGFLVEPGDVDALHNRLRTLLADADLRRRMGAESYRILNSGFEITAVVEELVGIYRELLMEQPRSPAARGRLRAHVSRGRTAGEQEA